MFGGGGGHTARSSIRKMENRKMRSEYDGGRSIRFKEEQEQEDEMMKIGRERRKQIEISERVSIPSGERETQYGGVKALQRAVNIHYGHCQSGRKRMHTPTPQNDATNVAGVPTPVRSKKTPFKKIEPGRPEEPSKSNPIEPPCRPDGRPLKTR